MAENTEKQAETTQKSDEGSQLWQEYLQKCCEVGQLRHNLDQLDGQKRQMEKQLEVTAAAVAKVANKHREWKQAELVKTKPEAGMQ